VCGWWGFPWGLVLTPVQITRNIVGICARPDSSKPSADLRKLVMVSMAAEAIQRSKQMGPPPLPQ
jgi:hypothetical protein